MYKISSLQLITCDHPSKSVLEVIEELCDAGIDWIQLRLKDQSDEKVLQISKEARRITSASKTCLIINDYVNVASAVNADGVHLGKNDMSPADARRILGSSMIIGGTANTKADIIRLTDQEVNYIGAGPFRFTSTKKNLSPVLGLDGISELASVTSIPVVAIGGITVNDLDDLNNSNIHGVAIASAIIHSSDMKGMIKEFKNKLNLVTDEDR